MKLDVKKMLKPAAIRVKTPNISRILVRISSEGNDNAYTAERLSGSRLYPLIITSNSLLCNNLPEPAIRKTLPRKILRKRNIHSVCCLHVNIAALMIHSL